MMRPESAAAEIHTRPSPVMEQGSPAGRLAGDVIEEIFLLGHPPLRRYLDVMRDLAASDMPAETATLVDEWRIAHEHYLDLAEQEAGLPDTIEYRELDSSLSALEEQVRRSPAFRNTFDALPTTFGMVELEKLVISQAQVTKTFIDDLALRLPAQPSPAELFQFCLASDKKSAPVRIRKLGSLRYAFDSDSTDLQYFGPELIQPSQLVDFPTFGPVAGTVGIVVGFGSNFLNVLHGDNRFLLHNGYHRACALYQRGIRFAPCIIQTVTRRDEIDIAAKRAVARDPGYYFKAPRPPLLKDFFNPLLGKVVKLKRTRRTIEIKIEVHTSDTSETYV